MIKNGFLNFKWYIVGDGSEYNKLKLKICEKNLEDKIFLLGNQVNPYPYVKYADIYVHTSYVESQGIAILEAMSLGKICVVTKSEGALEFCKDEYNSFLCEQNSSDLYNVIIKVFNYDELEIKNNTDATVKVYMAQEIISKINDIL